MLIYNKTLAQKITANPNLNPVTMMSTDMQRITQGMQYLHELCICIPSLGLALWLLQRQAGTGAVAPIVMVVGKSCTSISYGFL